MSDRGLVLREESPAAARQAKRQGLGVTLAEGWGAPYARTLYVTGGAAVPWDLLDAGFHFLERWDAAAPLWRYNVTAADVGAKRIRRYVEGLVRDLRVPLYATELLFAGDSAAGGELVDRWRWECREQGAETNDDERLLFVYALYAVKPLFLALPRSWLHESGALPQMVGIRPRSIGPERVAPGTPLVRVEIAPGRYVRCHPDEVEKYRQRYQQQIGGRRR